MTKVIFVGPGFDETERHDRQGCIGGEKIDKNSWNRIYHLRRNLGKEKFNEKRPFHGDFRRYLLVHPLFISSGTGLHQSIAIGLRRSISTCPFGTVWAFLCYWPSYGCSFIPPGLFTSGSSITRVGTITIENLRLQGP